jgi:hypothetical protein
MYTFRKFCRKRALPANHKNSRELHIRSGPAAVIALEAELWTTALVQRQAMQTNGYANSRALDERNVCDEGMHVRICGARNS